MTDMSHINHKNAKCTAQKNEIVPSQACYIDTIYSSVFERYLQHMLLHKNCMNPILLYYSLSWRDVRYPTQWNYTSIVLIPIVWPHMCRIINDS